MVVEIQTQTTQIYMLYEHVTRCNCRITYPCVQKLSPVGLEGFHVDSIHKKIMTN